MNVEYLPRAPLYLLFLLYKQEIIAKCSNTTVGFYQKQVKNLFKNVKNVKNVLAPNHNFNFRVDTFFTRNSTVRGHPQKTARICGYGSNGKINLHLPGPSSNLLFRFFTEIELFFTGLLNDQLL